MGRPSWSRRGRCGPSMRRPRNGAARTSGPSARWRYKLVSAASDCRSAVSPSSATGTSRRSTLTATVDPNAPSRWHWADPMGMARHNRQMAPLAARPGSPSRAELLGGPVRSGGSRSGPAYEHMLRSAVIATRIADRLGLDRDPAQLRVLHQRRSCGSAVTPIGAGTAQMVRRRHRGPARFLPGRLVGVAIPPLPDGQRRQGPTPTQQDQRHGRPRSRMRADSCRE